MQNSNIDSSFQNPAPNFFARTRASLFNHKRHILVFIFSIIIGVGVGIGLNYGFSLSGGNLIVQRNFKKNQALQYGRVLSSCFGGSSNTSNSSKESITDEQCNVDRMILTFYVKNSSSDGFFLIAHVDDHKNFLMNVSSANNSMGHNFSFDSESIDNNN